MSTNQLIALNAILAACVYAAGLLLGVGFGLREASGKAGPTNARLAARVRAAGVFLSRAIRGVQQIGPSHGRVGPAKNLARTGMGPQRDLFGTPFGPPFPTRISAKYANLPEIRRIVARDSPWCHRKRAPRREIEPPPEAPGVVRGMRAVIVGGPNDTGQSIILAPGSCVDRAEFARCLKSN